MCPKWLATTTVSHVLPYTRPKQNLTSLELKHVARITFAWQSKVEERKKKVNFPEVVLSNSLASSKNHMFLLEGKKMEQGKLHSFPKNYKV